MGYPQTMCVSDWSVEMTKKVRVVPNAAGIREMLTSAGVSDAVMGVAEQIAGRAGAGYVAVRGTSSTVRAHAFARTDTPEAMRDNARNATLLKSMGGQ